MAFAVNASMFIIRRFTISTGLGVAATATRTYAEETCPRNKELLRWGFIIRDGEWGRWSLPGFAIE